MSVGDLTSKKFKFFSFLSMVLLVYVHGYNLQNSYLQPFSTVHEPLTVTTFTEYFLANGLFRFRIPMLFIISGFLFTLGDDKPQGTRISKRARTLLLPYIIWGGVAILITFLLQQNSFTAAIVQKASIDQFGDNRPYAAQPIGLMIRRWIFAPPSFQLWFIRCLFFYNLLYPLMLRACTKYPWVWFSVVGFLWFTTSGFYFVEGEGLMFFSLGIFIAKKGFDIEQPLNKKLWWIACIVFIGSALAKTILAFYVKDNIPNGILLSVLHKTTEFAGLVTMWYGIDSLIKYLMHRQWFVWISGFAFIIFAMHVPLVNYLTTYLSSALNYLPLYRFTVFLAAPTIIIICCIAFGALFRKLLPKVYSVCTGGRGM